MPVLLHFKKSNKKKIGFFSAIFCLKIVVVIWGVMDGYSNTYIQREMLLNKNKKSVKQYCHAECLHYKSLTERYRNKLLLKGYFGFLKFQSENF